MGNYMGNAFHTKEFITKVLNLRYKDNMSSTQVVKELGEEYFREHRRLMTRNVIIGLWNRNKRLVEKEDIAKEIVAVASKIKLQKVSSTYIGKDTQSVFRVRKCLSCRKEVMLEKNIYICTPCKQTENYKYATTSHSCHT